jgi:geranylgeranyl diphosphate synthase type I
MISHPTTAESWFETVRSLVEPSIRTAVEHLDGRNGRVAGYHLGFLDADGAAVDRSRGKGVRGALALLSARAANAEAAVGVPAAVACELVHESSLLHDDIIDSDAVRRSRPTAWTVFGAPSAILAGDALLAVAFESLAGSRPAFDGGVRAASAATNGLALPRPGNVQGRADPEILHGRAVSDPEIVRGRTLFDPRTPNALAVSDLATATRRLLAGQAADLDFETRAAVGVDEARAMVADKTGALLGCAASLGAVLAGGRTELTAALRAYGLHLGAAFQLVDDILGIWGEPDRTGKPVWSDLRSRKKSLPVVAALASESAAGQQLSMIYGTQGPLDDAQLAAAAAAVEAAGGRDWAVAEAEQETRDALAIIDALDLADPVRADLVAVTEALVGRDR